MAERFVGIDVALREHRIAASTVTVSSRPELHHRREPRRRWPRCCGRWPLCAATAAQTLIGLEASGHLWENLEAALVGAGYRVMVLNR